MKIDTAGIDFEPTADAHSRKVRYYGNPVGTLLFHDWKFKWEAYPVGPVDLHLATAILVKAKEDPSVNYQKSEDEQRLMMANARENLLARGIVLEGLSDAGIVELCLRLERR